MAGGGTKMSMTDPIADLLTRIRNGIQARHERVELPASKLKVEIARILKSEGFISNFKLVEDKVQPMLRVYLKYSEDGEPVIHGIERISRPGRRVYRNKQEIPRVLGGLGLAIVSTSKGVLSGTEAVKNGVGGEVLCQVW
jgi:small subunit ribosomal protein S8